MDVLNVDTCVGELPKIHQPDQFYLCQGHISNGDIDKRGYPWWVLWILHAEHEFCHREVTLQGVHRSGKSHGKVIGHGKVMEFCFWSWKIKYFGKSHGRVMEFLYAFV